MLGHGHPLGMGSMELGHQPQLVVAKKGFPEEGHKGGPERYMEWTKEGEHNIGRRNNIGEDPKSYSNIMDHWAETEHKVARHGARKAGNSQIRAYVQCSEDPDFQKQAFHLSDK